MLGTMDNLKKLMEINLTITQSDLRYFQIIRNIFKRKRELSITDSMFAQKIGVSDEELQRWTKCPCQGLLDKLPCILDCLNVDMDSLLRDDEEI